MAWWILGETPAAISPSGQYGPFDLIYLGKGGAPGGDGVNADISNW